MHKLFLIILLAFSSCINNGMRKDLRKLNSTPVNIPFTLTTTYNGIDTTIIDIFESKLKLIIYTDSTGCSSCNVSRMYMWNSLLRYAESYNNKLKFYYIFYATKLSENIIRTSLMVNSMNYPVFIDKNGDFEKMNPHLPKNSTFHTFLLDENNKVILVGNPLHNKEIEKLFYKKTQELLSK